MDPSQTVLSEIPLFQYLPPSELTRLGEHLQRVELRANDVLYREGDPSDSFYIILDGQIEVLKAIDTPDETLLVIRGPGEYFGEVSLMGVDQKRTANIRARTDCVLLELSKSEFEDLLDRNPRMAFTMVRVLSERLNDANNESLRELQQMNRELREAYDELKDAQTQLIEKERLERELQVAHEIQMSLIPRSIPAVKGYDLGAALLPMAEVGGDFYDFVERDNGEVVLVVGDVSGHGVPAAMVMALTTAIGRAVSGSSDCPPDQVLRIINQQLIKMSVQNMFVTFFNGTLFPETGEFLFALAGHCPPLVARANGDVIQPSVGRSAMLGLFPDSPVSLQSVILKPGDTLLIFTDGLTEALNAEGEFFDDERLRYALKNLRHLPAQEICDRIIEQVKEFNNDCIQEDDISLICLKKEDHEPQHVPSGQV